MKQAAEEIVDMSKSLEASGFERRQADALVKAIATSIEKFAVTPDRLRNILEESQQKLYDRITREMNQRFDDVSKRLDDTHHRMDAMREDQRADASRLFTLVLSMALGMAGVVGGLIVDRLF